MLLDINQIQAVDDLPSTTIHIDEWGGDVKIRAMNVIDRIAFEKRNVDCKNELETMICLTIYSVVDENNNKIFDDTSFDMLAKKSAKALMRIFETAIDLSTLSQKGMETKTKNS